MIEIEQYSEVMCTNMTFSFCASALVLDSEEYEIGHGNAPKMF